MFMLFFFFFNDTATTEIYTSSHTLSLHDALPISQPETRSANENGLPDANGAGSALDQCVHEPAANQQVNERGEQPGNAGEQDGVQQVHVKRALEIGRQPR